MLSFDAATSDLGWSGKCRGIPQKLVDRGLIQIRTDVLERQSSDA